MQVKKIKEDGLKHELELTVPAANIDAKRTERLKEVGQNVNLPGFRKGKVPMAMLEQKYGRAVMGEVLEAVVNESTVKALQDHKLKPAMQPKIEVKEFDEGKDLVIKIDLEVLPEVKVADLKGLKLEKPVAKIDDKEVDEALNRIASSNKETKEITEDRATKKGDVAVITFHGRTADDNKEHPGMHAHDAKLELGSGQFIPGFEDQLMGKKKGDKVEVKVTFPEDYGATELAGRDAIFDVVVEAIHEAAETKIDDEFAKKLGMDDVAKLKDAVKEQMGREYEGLTRMKQKRQLLDALDETHKFDVPQSMLDAEYDMIVKQMTQERQSQGEEGDLSDDDQAELKTIAERRVRLGLVLSEIGTANGIQVMDQDLQRAVIMEAQKYPGQEKAVFDFYQKNQQALESLRAPIFEDKVVDYIFGVADVTEKEVSVEELTAQDDDEVLPSAKKDAKKTAKKAAKKTASKKKA